MLKESKLTLSLMLVAIIALAFGAGFAFGRTTPSTTVSELDIVKQAWDTILTEYVDRDSIENGQLKGGAIEGMLASLDDPHSAYLNIQAYELGTSDMEGEFDGIGAYVWVEDGQLVIVAPIPGSPAEKAGVRAGDIILKINGEPFEGMSLAEAILKIRGPSGTAVRLLTLHKDETEPVEIEIVRTTVELPSVQFEMMGDTAYISITQFSERTDTELIPYLLSLDEEKASYIILDLRGNGGGILNTVVAVTSHFLHDGIVLQIRDQDGNMSSEEVIRTSVTTDLPMVILVDESSASGSEVLAGALQDYSRAIVAGNVTFGKGSVNVLYPLDDGSGLYLTIARWLTPNGRLIEGHGIDPDYLLEVTGDAAIDWAIDYLTGRD
jgi:carboxyl-terminal processing protease